MNAMQGPPVHDRLFALGETANRDHEDLSRFAVLTWRSDRPDGAGGGILPDFIPLQSLQAVVFRRQFVQPRGGRPWKSAPLTVFNLVLNADNIVVAKPDPHAEFELLLPAQMKWDNRRFNPERSLAMSTLVVNCFDSIEAVHHGAQNPVLSPRMPDVWFGFADGALPSYQVTPALEQDGLKYVRGLVTVGGAPEIEHWPVAPDWAAAKARYGDAVIADILAACWVGNTWSPEGFSESFLPQAYLIGRRDVKPDRVIVDTEKLRGLVVNNPTIGAVQDIGIWPKSLSPGNVEAYRTQIEQLAEPELRGLIDEVRSRLGSSAIGLAEADVVAAITDPFEPIVNMKQGRIDVLEIGYPSLEALTFKGRGLDLDLYSLSGKFDPVPKALWRDRSARMPITIPKPVPAPPPASKPIGKKRNKKRRNKNQGPENEAPEETQVLQAEMPEEPAHTQPKSPEMMPVLMGHSSVTVEADSSDHPSEGSAEASS